VRDRTVAALHWVIQLQLLDVPNAAKSYANIDVPFQQLRKGSYSISRGGTLRRHDTSEVVSVLLFVTQASLELQNHGQITGKGIHTVMKFSVI
jgi:hypothetical protein